MEDGDTLFVVSSFEQARVLNQFLPPGCKAVWPGAPMVGRAYKRVQKLCEFEQGSWEEDWFSCAVLTRLRPIHEYIP